MDEQTRQLADARDREAATREILRVISRSPGDYEPVFQTILENAIRLCGAPFGALLLVRGEILDVVADTGLGPEFLEFIHTNPHRLDDSGSLLATAVHERAPQQRAAPDEETYGSQRPLRIAALELTGIRTLLGVPIIIGDEAIGVIALWRQEVKAFTDDEIELVSTFADQAAIAIENVRQFQALQARTADLTKSLERQTATSDILSVISGSRDDYAPVFDTILNNAIRLCGAPFGSLSFVRGDHLHVVAEIGLGPELTEFFRANPHPLDDPGSTLGRAILERVAIQTADIADPNRPKNPRRSASVNLAGVRTLLCVPILKGEEAIGVISLWRQEVKPFADDDIELVSTFAEQAVIAIENVRQFQAVQERTADLTKSLERQTATSEILRSISQSPTDYAPIFDTILANAVRLCGAPFGTLFLLRDGHLHVVADAGSEPAMVEHLRTHPMPLDETSSVLVRAVIARAPLQQDLMDEAYHEGDPRRLVAVDRFGCRTWLGVPLLKSGEVIGAIALYRKVAEPFADDDVALMSTFADQAVIAIENVRLFQALETRNSQLGESLERQAATSEILRSISRSPTDYQPVFDTILESAARLCDAPLARLYLLRDGLLHPVADHGEGRPEFVEFMRDNPRPANQGTGAIRRALAQCKSIHVEDVKTEALYRNGDKYHIAAAELGGVRTYLTVPLIKGEDGIGVIVLYRREVRAFEDRHVGLVETFADQAVIAIENVRLFQALETRTTSLSQSLERQTATSEILRSISASPTDYAPVFDTILENATHLCGAPFGILYLLRDDHLHLVADVGARSEYVEYLQANPLALNNTVAATSNAAREREPRQLTDLSAAAARSGNPMLIASVELEGIRTVCAVPMLKGAETIGVIALYRREIAAFTDDDIALVSTFTDQAVIAIENVRLFQALESRNSALGESLERQTATSEILRSISRSPTDYQPVFDTILESATRLCDAPLGQLYLIRDGGVHLVAHRGGSRPEFLKFSRDNVRPADRKVGLIGRVLSERRPVQTNDFTKEALYRRGDKFRVAAVELEGIRSGLTVPLLKGEESIGAMVLYRREIRPFEERHVGLVETFADQAVIAIENVRLFNETGEALERQTATADILKVISSSPTDVQPVFDAIARSAQKLCDATISAVFRFDGKQIQFVAHHGWTPEGLEVYRQAYPLTPAEDKLLCRVLLEGEVVNVADIVAQFRAPIGQAEHGHRSCLAVPILREGVAIGAIVVGRRTPGLFLDRQIELLKTFADQAVIAIENVSLFQALEGRTADLTKTLERQTATSEILRSISQSPTDYAPVFQTILDNAIRLCGAPFGMLFLLRDGHLHMVAEVGARAEFVAYLRDTPYPVDRPSAVLAQAARERVPKQRSDQIDGTYRSGDPFRVAAVELGGIRTLLGVPMLKGGETVGVIALYRQEVKTFDDDDIELVTTFADQAVIAIENVRLFQALEGRTAELTKTLERQTATSEILRSISQSPTGYDPVFDTILENASRLCDVQFSGLFLLRDDHLHLDASLGGHEEFVDFYRANPVPLDTPDGVSAAARCARERIVQHDIDVRNSDSYRSGDKVRVAAVDLGGIRTLLMVPLFRDEETLGVIGLFRQEVRAFSDDEIELVRTFADQAVIAIENVNLFNETREALERQTASADILKVISDSPTDVQPVFDTILENAIRLCGAPFGTLFLLRNDHLHVVAGAGSRPEFVEYLRANPRSLKDNPEGSLVRAAVEGVPCQIEDLMGEGYEAANRLRVNAVEIGGIRTQLTVPMRKGDTTLGVIILYRQEVKRFADDDIELVATFADQAVIAIENVRMFQALEGRTTELTKTLERQTATSEILRSISRSPTDYAPVFDTILDNATRLCDAPLGALFLLRDEHLRGVASIGGRPGFVEFLTQHKLPIDEHTVVGQAALERRAVQNDILAALQAEGGQSSEARIATVEVEGARTFLAVPMLRDEQVVGVIAIYRREVRRFDDSMIELLETFADQAVIAIENVRLFQTVESRSSELAQSVAELEALGDIAQAVSSSLDVDTVLDTIVTRAVELSRADAGAINEFDEVTGTLPFRAAPGMEHMLEQPAPRLGEGAVGRAAATRAPVQIADITVPGAYTGRLTDSLTDLRIRALLAVPMMQNDHVLGTLVVARRTPGEFPPEAERLLRALGTQSAIAIRNARLFREIEDKGRELEAANRHKSEFLANMSHELRTPLNAVIGFSEVLGERMFGELNDKQAEYVTDIHDSGRHLLSLINDILDLSKVEAGAMELDLGRFALAPALDNALTLVRERAERRGIVLQAQLEDDLGEMEGDERKLKQILLNLLSNAIKFTGEGGKVTLEARQDGAHVHIAVRDTGVGISEEDLAVIFEEFKQVGTDYARKVEGTGLGLTLTKRFIEMHGGHITVTSEPGAGSVFTAVLPLRPAEQVT